MTPELLLPELSSREKPATTRDRISIASARLVVPNESKKLNTIQ